MEGSAFSNAGSLVVTNGALSIAGSISLASLGKLSLTNSAVAVGGVLDATGGTLSIGAGSAWGRIALTGTLRGGTIVQDDGSRRHRLALRVERAFDAAAFADKLHGTAKVR